MSFAAPRVRYPVLETEFAKELIKELKRACELARKSIQNAQRSQKQYNDRGVKDVKLQIGDLVMLKVELKFCLDRNYRGPYKNKCKEKSAILQAIGII